MKRLSNSMIKCINEMKERALVLVDDIPLMASLKIEQNVTKNKTFNFQIINIGRPAMKLFINGKFYKSYLYSNFEWSEER